jgi:O-antigen ligase
MSILTIIFVVYLAITAIMCLVRTKVGIAMYLFYFILVPYVNIGQLNLNTIFPLVLLAGYFFNYRFKTLFFKPLIPFIFLYIIQFFLIPFHKNTPLETQLYYFTSDFTKLALPFVIINIMSRNTRTVTLYTNTLLSAITINIVYTFFLTLIPGTNPYLETILPLSGQEFLDWYASPEKSNRIFGRISGVFPHPMLNGLFLCFSLILIFYLLKTKTHKKTYIILLALNIVSILVIGVRTAILTVIISMIIYLALERRLKLFFYLSLVLSIILLVIYQIPGMDDYIKSIFDSSSSTIGGSSLDMRLYQLVGAIFEIRENPILGNGYGWNIYYQVIHGDHPILLAFESLIFMILCDSGFIGFVIWSAMIFLFLKHIMKNSDLVHKNILVILLVIYLTYSIITGEYGYMKYFLTFYSILYMNSQVQSYKEKQSIDQIKTLSENEF